MQRIILNERQYKITYKVFFWLAAMFLASNCTCAVHFTYTAHVQLLAKNMAATHVHAICTRICIRNQTNTLRFVAKIILCMYLLYDPV